MRKQKAIRAMLATFLTGGVVLQNPSCGEIARDSFKNGTIGWITGGGTGLSAAAVSNLVIDFFAGGGGTTNQF
jgi:hypothetical protein